VGKWHCFASCVSSRAGVMATNAEGSSVVGPIGTLSRTAIHEAVTELSSSARRSGAASSSAIRRLRVEVERRLGIEIHIEDPALRDLFGYVLQVEALLCQAREEGKALLQGAACLCPSAESRLTHIFSNTQKGSSNTLAGLMDSFKQFASKVSATDAGMRPAEKALETNANQQYGHDEVAQAAVDAFWHTVSQSPNAGGKGSARYRMERRLHDEVFSIIDEQMKEHNKLRNKIRERQKYIDTIEQSQNEMADQHKPQQSFLRPLGAFKSGLRPLAEFSKKASPEDRMRAAQEAVTTIDAELLSGLSEIKVRALEIVSRAWTALTLIRKEFFAEMVGQWAPVATAFGATSASRKGSMAAESSTDAATPATASVCAESVPFADQRVEDVPCNVQDLNQERNGVGLEPAVLPWLHSGNQDLLGETSNSISMAAPVLHAGNQDLLADTGNSTQMAAPVLHSGNQDPLADPGNFITMAAPVLHAGNQDLLADPGNSIPMAAPVLQAGNQDLLADPGNSIQLDAPVLHSGNQDLLADPGNSIPMAAPVHPAGNQDLLADVGNSIPMAAPVLQAGNQDLVADPGNSIQMAAPVLHSGNQDLLADSGNSIPIAAPVHAHDSPAKVVDPGDHDGCDGFRSLSPTHRSNSGAPLMDLLDLQDVDEQAGFSPAGPVFQGGD